MLVLLGIGATVVLFNGLTKNKKIYQDIKNDLRRNYDEPLSIECWRGYGQYFHNSGNPAELRYRRNKAMSLDEIKKNYTTKQQSNSYLLNGVNGFNGWNFNTPLVRRQQFSGPSDEIHYPFAEMGSNWYRKYMRSYKPRVTRIIPWNGYGA